MKTRELYQNLYVKKIENMLYLDKKKMELVRQELGLRSHHNRNPVYLRITNKTNRHLDVIWISFMGAYIKYKKLPIGAFVDINTFETHPWIAVDSERKDRMLLNDRFVFVPKSWRKHVRELYPNISLSAIPPNVNIPRLLVTVTIPMYTLRYRALLEMRVFFQNESDVEALGGFLPKELLNDLKCVIVERNRFCSILD